MSSDQPSRPGALVHLAMLVADAFAPARQRRGSTPPIARLHALDRLDHWFWRRRQKDREAYLARATDLADVERRLRELDRRPYY